ncbi:uncharacterized protein PV06_04380 [Exophiala oligosperma]|uniref:Uncharacterized protein n=1 Tax=Exophiala oligosperma TaxID=215243 RepID=A0A0D2E617_9EURO|nr:uncharacterized protein PV06_04380 [Exophiala oligosperma]KIW43259.1 hypothetical protein PV06_04380 [Exophiala oligosperma]
MGLFEKLQSKLELYRLEQKYARRKNRTTYSTGAQYVDGEYVYPSGPDYLESPVSANSTGSSSGSSNKRRTMFWTPPDQRR